MMGRLDPLCAGVPIPPFSTPTMAAKQPNSTTPARRDRSHWRGQRQASGGVQAGKPRRRSQELGGGGGSFSSRPGAPLGKTERSLHLLAGWGPCGKGRRVAGHWLPTRSLPPPAIPWSWQGNWRNRTEAWRTPSAPRSGAEVGLLPRGPEWGAPHRGHLQGQGRGGAEGRPFPRTSVPCQTAGAPRRLA